eukprot:TRINITY_DN45361_c0_g1_i1.p1 TRINITY_DN45361_c0_g1~~TRINITY_DN45361_c0_g1_i1.p1  ORF type:complete len:1035 (+),score=146.14 TRINITY_DN45361_c0_g1_i1:79-3183(+)
MSAVAAAVRDYGGLGDAAEQMGREDCRGTMPDLTRSEVIAKVRCIGDGSDSQDFQRLVLACNKDGMDYLRKALYKQAFEQLKYAEAIIVARDGEDEPTNLMAVTCNNLGCYYKKVGKMHAALSYLRKALKIEVSLETDDVTVAGTHLNICAILSKLDKHDKAVQHALCALELISNRVNGGGDAVTQDEYSVLAIAHHNVAVERDHLKQWDQAADAYQQGHHVAKRCLGEQHPLTQTLSKNYDAALQKSQKYSSAIPPASPRDMPSRVTKLRDLAANTNGNAARAPGASAARGGQRILPEISNTRFRGGDESPSSIAPGRGPVALVQEAEDWMQNEESAGKSRRAHPHSVPASLPPPMPPQQSLSNAQSFASLRTQGAVAHHPTGLAGANALMGTNLPSVSQVMALTTDDVQSARAGSSGSAGGVCGVPDLSDPWAQPAAFLDPYVQDLRAANGAASTGCSPMVLSQQQSHSYSAVQPQLYREQDSADQSHPLVLDEKAADGPAKSSYRPVRPMGAPPERSRPVVCAGASAITRTTRAERDAARRNGSHATAAASAGVAGDTGEQRGAQSQLMRRSAAEKIQKAARQFLKAQRLRRGRRELERLSATRIQARWRAFSVRRGKHNKYATIIQRWMRGFLVRNKVARYRAAVRIQRHALGMLARVTRRRREVASLAIQRAARGMAARCFARKHREDVDKAVETMQRGARMWQGKQVAVKKRKQKHVHSAQEQSATKIQSWRRGNQARKKVDKLRRDQDRELALHCAATKIQSQVRRLAAAKRTEQLRRARLVRQHAAATTIRKHWLRAIYRRRYLELRSEFLQHESSIVTIQRFVRGYVVRSRMWRDAIRAEEEQWAVVEIQRCWRGFLGRVKWELAYEAVWSRDVAAQRLQRYVRGWLARTKVHRMRKRIARAEFLKARRRFRAAQLFQAVVRGHQCRLRVARMRQRKLEAVGRIQRVWRGHCLRVELWEKVQEKRLLQIQAVARGFLVRSRRFHAIAKVILIQRSYRHWLHFIPEAERRRRLNNRRSRRKLIASA